MERVPAHVPGDDRLQALAGRGRLLLGEHGVRGGSPPELVGILVYACVYEDAFVGLVDVGPWSQTNGWRCCSDSSAPAVRPDVVEAEFDVPDHWETTMAAIGMTDLIAGHARQGPGPVERDIPSSS